MEDVLEVYMRAFDPRFPQVCMDESAKQLLKDKRESLPAQPGQPERIDYTFEAAGMCKIFLAGEPLAGKRFVKVTERRTSEDWAYFIRELVDVHYPKAEKIVLVMDNLNTHTPSSLYSTFAPPEALRILKKLELHYTPVHGSWLNMAEIELSALARQCLSRRIGTQEELEREVLAWQQRRNEESITVNWRFTTTDARIKLKRLYPSLEPRKRSSSKSMLQRKVDRELPRPAIFATEPARGLMALLPNFVILLLSSMLVSRGHCDITMLLSSKMEPQHKKSVCVLCLCCDCNARSQMSLEKHAHTNTTAPTFGSDA